MKTRSQRLLCRLPAAVLTAAWVCVPIPSTAQELPKQEARAQSSAAVPPSPAPKPAAPQPPPLTVVAGQTAIDLALEHVPAGISVEQFLMAIYRLNPQAFSDGRIDRPVVGATLQLPTAAQAQSIGPQQARVQLQALRQAAAVAPAAQSGPNGPPVTRSGSAAAAASPTAPAQGVPAATTEPGGSPAVSEASPSASAGQAVDPAPAQVPAEAAGATVVSAPPTNPPLIDPLMLIGVGAALLALLWLLLKPAEPPRQRTATPKAPPNTPERPGTAGVSTQPAAPAPGPALGLKSLSDFGPLPSLDLDDPPAPKTAAAPVATSALDPSRPHLNAGDKRRA